MLHGKQRSNLLKIFLAVDLKIFHLVNVLFVILAFNKINLIPLSFIIDKEFGQISESTKMISFGFQIFKNFFTIIELSKGKNLCTRLLYSLIFSFTIFAELIVFVVIKIGSLFCFLLISSIIGKIVKASPILAAWNQIQF